MKSQIFLSLLVLFSNFSVSQSIDKIEAVIGSEILLTSDIENQYNQILSQGVIQTNNIKCDILDELLYQNLLIHHAKKMGISVEIDSAGTISNHAGSPPDARSIKIMNQKNHDISFQSFLVLL